ncbi:MAG TPA: diacylglycerol kinase family protein [Acidimicrobiales bacterium]
MRLLIIVNSFASSVTARNKVLIRQALRRDHDVAMVETNRRGHATRFAQDAASRGVEVVIALGGDGTLNEVANGLVGTETALAVLPGGSTNVFARTIGLPNDPVPAAQMLVRALAAGSITPVGFGQVNGRYFTFHTGIGYDAAVVAAVERRASLKRWAGHPLFVWAALSTWLRGYDRHQPHFRLCMTDGTQVSDGYFTVVLNTNPYTYLGNRPLDLSPAATLERPLVAVTFRTMKAGVIITTLAKALKGGGVESGPLVDCRTDLAGLVVESDVPFPYQVDGDHLGDTRRLQFRHVPAAVRLVLPSSTPAS